MAGDGGAICKVNPMENIQHSTFNIQRPRRSGQARAGCWRRCVTGLLVLLNVVSALLLTAQTIPITQATGSRLRYFYEPPNETKLKARVTVATMVPLGKTTLQGTQLHIETFRETGEPEAVIDAPDCVYDHATRTAWSAGDVKARTGDGKMSIEGTGFHLSLTDMSLTISNNVRTVYGAPVTFPKKL